MSGVYPIVAYRPEPRREEELLRLLRARVRTLRREGRANEHVAVIPGAKDGTTIQVTEWKSSEAIDAAHRNPDGHFPDSRFRPANDRVNAAQFCTALRYSSSACGIQLCNCWIRWPCEG
jgi:hypothetical protein